MPTWFPWPAFLLLQQDPSAMYTLPRLPQTPSSSASCAPQEPRVGRDAGALVLHVGAATRFARCLRSGPAGRAAGAPRAPAPGSWPGLCAALLKSGPQGGALPVPGAAAVEPGGSGGGAAGVGGPRQVGGAPPAAAGGGRRAGGGPGADAGHGGGQPAQLPGGVRR